MRRCFILILLLLIITNKALCQRIILLNEEENLKLKKDDTEKRIVFAKVINGKLDELWLSPLGIDEIRFMLTKERNNVFSINLQNPPLFAVLNYYKDIGHFRIYGKTKDGKIISSKIVKYAILEEEPLKLFNFNIYNKEGSIITLFKYEDYESEIPEYDDKRIWLDPETISKIIIKTGKNAKVFDVETNTGGKNLKISYTQDQYHKLATFILDNKLRKLWKAQRKMIFNININEKSRYIELLVKPTKIEIPKNGINITVVQRDEAVIPGTNDFLVLSIGDITGGQVLTEIYDKNGNKVLETISMKEGESVTFSLGKERYELFLFRLVNFLIGDDFAVFSITKTENLRKVTIEDLLKAIKHSNIIFIRNDKEYTGIEAANYLRLKWQSKAPNISDPIDFINSICTRSESTRKLYKVKLNNGKIIPARHWFLEQYKNLSGF